MRKALVIAGTIAMLLVGCNKSTMQQPVPGTTPTPPAATPQPVTAPPTDAITHTVTAQVHWLHPHTLGQPDDPPTVGTFVDADHGWMVQDWHQVLGTTDGGHQWHVLAQLDETVRDLRFVTPQQGWAITDSGELQTLDGGQTWQKLPEDSPLHGVTMRDEHLGWAMDRQGGYSPGHLRLTTDGGRTFTSAAMPCPSDTQPNAVSFINPETGWMLCGFFQGSGGSSHWLYRTTDGGRHWTRLTGTINGQVPFGFPPGIQGDHHQPLPDGALPIGSHTHVLSFVDAWHGWLSEWQEPTGGHIWFTADGGKTWHLLGLPTGDLVETFHLFTPQFGRVLATNQWGWAWLETRDGGKTWAPIYPSLRPLLANGLALQLLDGAHGVAGNSLQGFGSVLRTDDGGRSWRQVGRIAGEGIAALSFPDSQHGWAITGGSVGGHLVHHVYTTADGGATWALTPGYADLSGRYSAIDMVDRQTGYIGSYNDPFLVTHDRGATWAPVDSATPGSPTFRFASPSEGWMVRDGQLFATADGARTWTQLPLACHVMDVDLLPAGAGWLVVDSCPGDAAPALLATTDAGKTWTRVVIPDVGLTAISFADPLHGWLADNRGRLFMTDDGGLKWTEVLSNQAP